MMRMVHKFILPNNMDGVFQAPATFEPQFFGRQGTDYCVWAEVDTSIPWECRFQITAFGTGRSIPADYHYIGSVVADPHVWHAHWRKL